jgi:hypothetical protein
MENNNHYLRMLRQPAPNSPYGRLRAAAPRPTFALGLLGLFGEAFLVYWSFLRDFFVLDDFIWLQAASNPDPVDFFRRAFSFPDSIPVDRPTPFWRPLGDAYFFAAWRVFGLHPLPYHVVNVLLHGAIASLTAVLVWQLAGSRLAGLLAGLLFVVLPIFDWAVTWISQITELLAVFFSVLTLVLYTAYLRGSRHALLLYWGAFLSLLLALLSKESAVVLPALLAGLVLITGMPRTMPAAARRARELVPFVALALAHVIFLLSQEYSRSRSYEIGWHAVGNLWDYLRWITVPLPNNEGPWIDHARTLAAVAFLSTGAAAIAIRKPLLAGAFAWTVLALLSYSFFRTGVEYRYTYAASVPLVIFLALLIKSGYDRVAPGLGPHSWLWVAVWVLFAAAFLGRQTYDRQLWIGVQAELYSHFYHEAPAQCGPLPPESHVFLLDSPLWDAYGTSSAMALNLLYDDVLVYRVERSAYPGYIPYAENKCVLEYREGRFVALDRSISE